MIKPALEMITGASGYEARISGSWVLTNAVDLEKQIAKVQTHSPDSTRSLNLNELDTLDTTGSLLLLRLLDSPMPDDLSARLINSKPKHLQLLMTVAEALQKGSEPRRLQSSGVDKMFDRTGRWVVETWKQLQVLLHFVGIVMSTLFSSILQPWRMRWTALVYHLEHVGLDAVPIVSLLSFLVGGVIAYLGATILSDFGAQIYTVELVGYAFFREFGVLLPAILLAGRSGSSFTAQIGSMKSNEELDALKTLGMDPVSVLVLPRVLALVIMLPILSFGAMLMGLIGGGMVCAFILDISPGMFITRLYENTSINHFWVGISKAPIFAFMIAVVGCLEGFKVTGSAESVGQHTTSSVVQSIFLVLVADSMFAILFEQLGI